MIKIAIDHMPLYDNLLLANDFCSFLIFSNVMCPLFKYKDKKLVKYACKEVKVFNKKYVIEIRNNIKFSDGTKVDIYDYLNTIKYIMNNDCYTKYLLENIKSIDVINNQLVVILKRKDKYFLHRLSYYTISPYKNGKTCGKYYIYKKNNNSIILKKIPFFIYKTNNKLDELMFINYENKDDIKDFFLNKIDITNITTFPIQFIKKYKPNIIDSGLIFVLKFNNKYLKGNKRKNRRIISKIINIDLVNSKLYNIYEVLGRIENNRNIKLNKIKHKKERKENITLGYTDFYPNKLIAEELKKQLSSLYNVKLQEYELCKPNNCDLYIDIIFNPFSDMKYMYLSKYLKVVNGRFYNLLCNMYEITESKRIYKMMIKQTIFQSNIIPLLKSKYVFLCSNELKKVMENKDE